MSTQSWPLVFPWQDLWHRTRTKNELWVETQSYILTTAENFWDKIQCFIFRKKVFSSEYENKNYWPWDYDQYDKYFNHLVIWDKKSHQICGTYRLQLVTDLEQSYSNKEFELDDWIKSSGQKLELGRACIDNSHRNGQVLDLLWKGIGHFAKTYQVQYLFGLTSLSTLDMLQISQITKYLVDQKLLNLETAISARKEFAMDIISCSKSFNMKEFLPPLLQSYLKAGANILSYPALDTKFGSVDYLTVLDINNLNSSYARRYFN